MSYEWYERVKGIVTQGDIFLDFPIPVFWESDTYPFFEGSLEKKSVIVMTQACDIENKKVANISFCEILLTRDLAIEALIDSKEESIVSTYKSKIESLKNNQTKNTLSTALSSLNINLKDDLKKLKTYLSLKDYINKLSDTETEFVEELKNIKSNLVSDYFIEEFLEKCKDKLKAIQDSSSKLTLREKLAELDDDLENDVLEMTDYRSLQNYLRYLMDKNLGFEEDLKALKSYMQSEYIKHYVNDGNLKAIHKFIDRIRKGEFTDLHLLNEFLGNNTKILDSHVVLLKDTYSLPVDSVKKIIENNFSEGHYRLLPPYREHLAQAYANTFNRIGLPIDIKVSDLELSD